jgi:tetraacyldisaccharide 4'-kinase
MLAPLVPLYRAGISLRDLRLRYGWEPVRRLRWPVVSIGNLSTGGAGKTPLTIALARALAAQGFAVDVLSRGYGRQSGSAEHVRRDGRAQDFGDEPLLIAAQSNVPVYVARQRFEAGTLAESSLGAGGIGSSAVHLLDDGFQHRQLHRDVDIVLLNRQDWQDRLLPAGNLREPRQALRRATVIAIPAEERELEGELRTWGWSGPVWRLHRRMAIPMGSGSMVVAFCGIAQPGQFFAGLEAAGMRVVDRLMFPDHHRYQSQDLERIREAARVSGASALVTTEKDQVRLRDLPASLPTGVPIVAAGLKTEIEDEEASIHWLVSLLKDVDSPVSAL